MQQPEPNICGIGWRMLDAEPVVRDDLHREPLAGAAVHLVKQQESLPRKGEKEEMRQAMWDLCLGIGHAAAAGGNGI